MVTLGLVTLVYLSIGILSTLMLLLLLFKYIKDNHQKYGIHALTRMLIILTFFLALDGVYNYFLYASKIQLISPKLFVIFSEPGVMIWPNLGIFISSVVMVHFILEKRIELFKENEISLTKLVKLNKELEVKAHELEKEHEFLQSRIFELEKHNEIAKDREKKMMDLLKKVDALEKQLGHKK